MSVLMPKTTVFVRRWGLSLSLLSVSLVLGGYVLWWNNPLDSQGPFDSAAQPTDQTEEPLTVYRWDTLERMRLVGKVKPRSAKTVAVNYERAAPRDPGVWRVVGKPMPLRLSDFEQVLLENTLTQLRVLNVRRALLTKPTPAQLEDFGLSGLGAIEVILQGQKNGTLQEQRLLIGHASPTGSGYYFYIPALQQVYLGYVNIPEALQQLLARSAAALS